jgi:hypothetical protein
MASIGDLVVNLAANATEFQKGLSAAQSHLNAFAAAMTAFATASVARFIQVGSALDDMTQRTGVSVEMLSGLSHAAQMSDTSLESLQSGLVKMAKFTESAADGAKAAQGTLTQLGLSVRQLKALTPDQQFLAFADALNAIEDPGKRASVAMEVFGKGAVELDILLKEGSSGIREFIGEAYDLNKVMSGETAAAAAETADAIDNMLKSLDAVVIAIGKQLAPIVRFLADALRATVTVLGDFGPALGIAAIAVGGAVIAMNAITRATKAYADAKILATALTGPKGWIALAAALGVAAIATAAVTSQMQKQNEQLLQQQIAADKAAQAQRNLAAANAEAAKPKAKTDFEARGERLAALQKQFNELQTQTAQGQIDAFRGKIAQLTDDFNTLNRLGMATLTEDQFRKFRQASVDAFTGITDSVQKLQEELAILRGETTEQEQEYARLAARGASDEQIQQLRTLNAERDALLKKQREEAKINEESAAYWAERVEAQKMEAAAAKDRAAAIIESLKTPEQKLMEQLADVEALRKRGMLTAEQATAAEQKLRDEMKGTGTPDTAPKFASAMLKGSTEAYSTILQAMRSNPQVDATEKQTKVLGAKLDKIANKPAVEQKVVENLAS